MAILQPDFALVRLYDRLEKWWESQATMRRVAGLTMCIYLTRHRPQDLRFCQTDG